jgi:predicted MPP superfamily phosphohydrolase
VKTVRLAAEPTVRLVHFSDLHYKGERGYLDHVIATINRLEPDFACFTGDIVEDREYLGAALETMAQIDCPVYGVPGNHDYWSGAAFNDIRACLLSTGGAWLTCDVVTAAHGRCIIEGLTMRSDAQPTAGIAEARGTNQPRRILLLHYPAQVNELKGARYDVVLAGHSHGGQVRIPFYGAPVLPYQVGAYEAGLYETPLGPLYVNVGVGTFYRRIRFFCRPELTVIEL